MGQFEAIEAITRGYDASLPLQDEEWAVLPTLVAGRIALPRLFAQAARTKRPELFLAATLLVVIGASLATAVVGLSPIVGALIAGLLIAEALAAAIDAAP